MESLDKLFEAEANGMACVLQFDSFVSLFQMLKTYPSGRKHSFWVLIAWLQRSKCFDIRDRVYALLSVAEHGFSFTVDYDEDAYSLFWRCGEHFRAWTEHMNMDLLRNALLSMEEPGWYERLAAAMPEEVTVDATIWTVWNSGKGQAFRELVKCTKCNWEYNPSHEEELGTTTTGLILVFCLGHFGGTHILLVKDRRHHPFSVRFFPGSRATFSNDPLDLHPDSLLQHLGGCWVEARDTEDFESLTSEREVQYKFKVPAGYILALMH